MNVRIDEYPGRSDETGREEIEGNWAIEFVEPKEPRLVEQNNIEEEAQSTKEAITRSELV